MCVSHGRFLSPSLFLFFSFSFLISIWYVRFVCLCAVCCTLARSRHLFGTLHGARAHFLQGCAKEFTTLKALITHHSVMPEQLPVTLTLARPKHLLAQRRNLDDYDTYESIDDFHKLMI